ncbi:cytochrome p450 [Trichoderma arundinaceum]|uniref:Cytochrome p450 n=1 Tax=Trichoderma arundinaceum TaxID=490622 RepID=A0A395NNW3_TRIAR|nr:cytochrome p450 [Trichoderma arundinaceum]
MTLSVAALIIGGTYVLSRIIYNLCFHALSKYPGPVANRVSILPKVYHLISGSLPYHVTELHQRYGPVVRIAPNELAFTDPRAWRDIYARKLIEGRYELAHDMAFYKPTNQPHDSILSSNRQEHDNIRKLLSPGFSDRAMKAQEPTIGRYVNMLIQRLQENCIDMNGNPKVINMRDWLAFCTFDMIGDLAFGSDFGCLQNGGYHPWVALIAGSVRDLATLQALKMLGVVRFVRYVMLKLSLGTKALKMHVELTKLKTEERVKLGDKRDDFLNGLIQDGMSPELLRENGSLLILAGSETTATLLTGILYLLAKHDNVLERLKSEVRGEFASASEMTLSNMSRLPYMLAVLKEGLRCYPPVAGNSPRLVPPAGTNIAGCLVPGGTVVGIWQWAMYHDPTHFDDPYSFDPDRFLILQHREKPSNTKIDKVEAFNPFLIGPRNCIGQNLAYAEMRLILARLIWKFDLDVCVESNKWMHTQKNFLLWEKPSLYMYLTPR